MYPLTILSSFLTQQLVSCLLPYLVQAAYSPGPPLFPCPPIYTFPLVSYQLIYILHTSKVSAHYCLGALLSWRRRVAAQTFPGIPINLSPKSVPNSLSLKLLCRFAHKPTTRLLTAVRFRTVCCRGGMGSLVLLGFCRFGWGVFWRRRASAFREALILRVRLQYCGCHGYSLTPLA